MTDSKSISLSRSISDQLEITDTKSISLSLYIFQLTLNICDKSITLSPFHYFKLVLEARFTLTFILEKSNKYDEVNFNLTSSLQLISIYFYEVKCINVTKLHIPIQCSQSNLCNQKKKRKTHCNNSTCQSTPMSSNVLVLIHNTHVNTTHIVRIVLWGAQSVCMETTAVTKPSVRKHAKYIYGIHVMDLSQVLLY